MEEVNHDQIQAASPFFNSLLVHMDDDDEEAARRRQQYRELFGTDEQQEVEANELAARQAQREREEILAWCRQRAEAKQQRPVVEKAAQQQKDAAAYWQKRIRDEVDKGYLALRRAVADVVGKQLNAEERARKQGDEELKGIIFDTQRRFDDHPTHDVIKALRTRIDELQARLDALEQAAAKPAQLRAVS